MPSDSTSKPSPTGQPRPRQVTWAVVLITGGSVLGVLFAFQRIATLGSLEVRESYEEVLAPFSGTGLSVDTYTDFLRIASTVLGGVATATAILGIYVLQRLRSARIGLSVLAPLLFLGGLLASDLVLVFAAVGVIMLWTHPISDWYAGRPIPEQRPRPTVGSPTSGPGRSAPPTPAAPPAGPPLEGPPPPAAGPDQHDQPRPSPGFGAAPATAAYPPPARPPQAHPQQGQPPQRTTVPPRPAQVVVAGVLTWVASGLTLLFFLLFVVVVLAAPDTLLEEVLRQQPELRGEGLTEGQLQGSALAVGGAVVLWCVLAIVAAVLAVHRVGWARTGLLVSAVLAAVLSLAATLLTGGAGAPALITLALSLATISMLLRPEVRAWFAAPRS